MKKYLQNYSAAITVSFLLFFSHSLHAQTSWTVYNAANSMLPDNSVRALEIAPDGKLWIGTDYGLASFDGSLWEVFTVASSGLPDNTVRCLAADTAGVMWIGTFNGGLARYDGSNWTVYNSQNSGLPDDFVRSLVIDSSGNIWAGTIGGLGVFDGSSWVVYNMSNSPLLSSNYSALYTDSALTVLGTINGGMAIVTGPTWNYFNIWNSNLPDNTCLGITRDTSGTIWIATPAYGISAYVGGFAFLTLSTASSTIPTNSTTSISCSPVTDHLWIGTTGSGLVRKSGMAFTAFSPANSPLPDSNVQCVKAAADGIVWAGTQSGGLVRVDPSLFTGVASHTPTQQLMVYPSEASLYIFHEGSNITSFSLYNVGGATAGNYKNVSQTGQTTIDISGLTSGVYVLKVFYRDGSSAVARFVR